MPQCFFQTRGLLSPELQGCLLFGCLSVIAVKLFKIYYIVIIAVA